MLRVECPTAGEYTHGRWSRWVPRHGAFGFPIQAEVKNGRGHARRGTSGSAGSVATKVIARGHQWREAAHCLSRRSNCTRAPLCKAVTCSVLDVGDVAHLMTARSRPTHQISRDLVPANWLFSTQRSRGVQLRTDHPGPHSASPKLRCAFSAATDRNGRAQVIDAGPLLTPRKP
jgi:hypothetical protein